MGCHPLLMTVIAPDCIIGKLCMITRVGSAGCVRLIARVVYLRWVLQHNQPPKTEAVDDLRRQMFCGEELAAWSVKSEQLSLSSTTLVSPLTQAGDAQPHADRVAGAALEQAANRKRLRAYPELAVARRCAWPRSWR